MARLIFEGDDRAAEVLPGKSALEAAAAAGLPLSQACGGHGKCSTCRILVLDGLSACSPLNDLEKAMAVRLGFPPEVRLGCQTRFAGDATVRRLVRDEADARLVGEECLNGAPTRAGEDRRLAILFCDIRNFTAFSERHEPYDVIHTLNRWFAIAERAIKARGGTIDNFIGDGMVCLFGMASPGTAARDAALAALDLVALSREMSAYTESLFHAGFRIGVGIHTGDVVLGAVGAGERRRLTVIGDAVNLASRVESANKETGTEVLVTESVKAEVGDLVTWGRRVDLPIKGKTGVYRLHEIVTPARRG